jgi:hypothetical protein
MKNKVLLQFLIGELDIFRGLLWEIYGWSIWIDIRRLALGMGSALKEEGAYSKRY